MSIEVILLVALVVIVFYPKKSIRKKRKSNKEKTAVFSQVSERNDTPPQIQISHDIPIEKFCPNCGGPVGFESDKCIHCGSFLPGIAAYRKAFELREKQIRANDKVAIAEKELEAIKFNKKLEFQEKREERRDGWRMALLCVVMLFGILFISLVLPKIL